MWVTRDTGHVHKFLLSNHDSPTNTGEDASIRHSIKQYLDDVFSVLNKSSEYKICNVIVILSDGKIFGQGRPHKYPFVL